MSIAGSNSRFAIINWINDTLLLPLTRIQQLGAGNVYCQILDAAYPERVPIHKVKWDAKLEVDFLHNFKILQNSFEYLGIQKKIDIQRLAKARYQDNLEFVQWLKTYVEQKIDYAKYEPLKRRNYAKLFLNFLDKKRFNVTLATTSATGNKQNLDSSTVMRSSIKSNATMKSMISSRSSISMISTNNSKNATIQKNNRKQKESLAKIVEKRRTIGPASFLTGSQKNQTITKNISSSNITLSKDMVKNVQAIQSEGQDDQFF